MFVDLSGYLELTRISTLKNNMEVSDKQINCHRRELQIHFEEENVNFQPSFFLYTPQFFIQEGIHSQKVQCFYGTWSHIGHGKKRFAKPISIKVYIILVHINFS